MAHTSTIQFITAVKLNELRAQRGQLRLAYDVLADRTAAVADPYERLRVLYTGLTALTLAGHPLHPELADLRTLTNETLLSGMVSEDLVARWLDRLTSELAAGSLRSEFVFRFGALLEQWANSPGGARPRPGPGLLSGLRASVLAPAEPNRHREVIERLLAGIRVPENMLGGTTAVDQADLSSILEALSGDPYQAASLRAEAARFAEDDALRGELADALTLLGGGPDALRWPAAGVNTRAVWTRNKWRLFPTPDLPTACLLGLTFARWENPLYQTLGNGHALAARQRRHRLDQLVALNAPEILIAQERQRLAEAERRAAESGRFLVTSEPGDVWDPILIPPIDRITDYDPDLAQHVSVLGERRRQLQELNRVRAYDGYGQDGFSPVAALVNAEVALARAAFPDRPVYLVKLDLRDYYPSIPHDLVLTILRTLGLPAPDLDLVSRFLAVPLAGEPDGPAAGGDRPGTARRGVPHGSPLSALLAEAIGRCLEGYVQERTPVRIIRLVDDICLLTPDPEAAIDAWRHVIEFCDACGLTLNDDKFGALCVGGTLPEVLAAPPPRWGMLTLNDRGEWGVHEPTFQRHVEQSRRHIAAAGSVLSKVDIINADLTHLVNALAVGTDLGETHRRAVSAALVRFHADYFGPGQDIATALCEEIIRLVRDPNDASDASDARDARDRNEQRVPEAWLYWPVTAGGLGLRNPHVLAGQFAEAFRRRSRVAPPAPPIQPGWNTRNNEWARYYRKMLEPLEPATPSQTVAMKSLVEDFIARGTTISHGKQSDLTPYWRWILSIYGPEIRERFGTFRFLNTELVPLHLLGQRRIDDRPTRASSGTAAPGTTAPPF